MVRDLQREQGLSYELQWGHGREAMDGHRRLGRWPFRLCFNGATAVRPWMARQNWHRVGFSCFNGATAVRPWMAAARAAALLAYSGFNGATAVRPWMGEYDPETGEADPGLQWGHGREAMDGRVASRRHKTIEVASMGPRP